jgi:UDP-GlcNAc:undecaprenyl-phosphate GlcNAc-1-phosphate transferase
MLTSSSHQALVGFAVGSLLSLALIGMAPKFGFVDNPDHGRKIHTRPTARTGGIVLWAALVMFQTMGWLPWRLHWTEWLGLHSMACIGVLDDRWNLRARYKAIVGLAVAILLAVHASMQLSHEVSQVIFLYLKIPTGVLYTAPFLLFWFWSIPQAFNLIDGVNGLSMGFSLLVLGVLGWHSGVYPAAFMGALLATFVLNFPRAKHFLGDSGALLLGTLLAILAVRLVVPWYAALPVWIFAYPIFDVSLVVAIRKWNGVPLVQADRSHLHHWMMDRLGGRTWLVSPILLVLGSMPMARATNFPGAAAISTTGVLALAVLASKALLDRIPPRPERVPTQERRELSLGPGPTPQREIVHQHATTGMTPRKPA